MATLPRSSDSRVRFTVTGSDGNPITISGLEDLDIYIYQKPKKVIQQWNLDDGTIDIITDAAGLVEVLLDRANTQFLLFQSDRSEVKGEVRATFVDADFEDGLRVEIATDITLFFDSEEVIAVNSQTAEHP